jgi:biopolymer transport protein ExbB/TolQ
MVYVVITISVLLLSILLIGFKIRNLFRLDVRVEKSFIFRFLLFGSIRSSYRRVVQILEYPCNRHKLSVESRSDPIYKHLNSIADSQMDIAIEMQKMIEQEMQSLLNNCEKQLRYLSTVVVLIVVAAIFFFLVSAYSPIFVIGDIV